MLGLGKFWYRLPAVVMNSSRHVEPRSSTPRYFQRSNTDEVALRAKMPPSIFSFQGRRGVVQGLHQYSPTRKKGDTGQPFQAPYMNSLPSHPNPNQLTLQVVHNSLLPCWTPSPSLVNPSPSLTLSPRQHLQQKTYQFPSVNLTLPSPLSPLPCHPHQTPS